MHEPLASHPSRRPVHTSCRSTSLPPLPPHPASSSSSSSSPASSCITITHITPHPRRQAPRYGLHGYPRFPLRARSSRYGKHCMTHILRPSLPFPRAWLAVRWFLPFSSLVPFFIFIFLHIRLLGYSCHSRKVMMCIFVPFFFLPFFFYSCFLSLFFKTLTSSLFFWVMT